MVETLLLKDGLLFDGSGSAPVQGSVVVRDGVIKRVVVGAGAGSSGSGVSVDADTRVLDLSGMWVMPGFIDIHTHSDFTILSNPGSGNKLLQGVTTEVGGNCGMSSVPLSADERKRRAGLFEDPADFPKYDDLSGYFAALSSLKPAVNYVQLVGHNTLRRFVVGEEARPAESSEISRMCTVLEGLFDEGALGLSFGLVYMPGQFAEKQELVALASVAGRMGRVVTVHMRSEDDGLLDSLDEMISVCEEAGARLVVSHLKTWGSRNWGMARDAILKIESAVERGMDVHFDRYPYTAANTDLDILVPGWVKDGGEKKYLERLADPKVRLRVASEISAAVADEGVWERMRISSLSSSSGRFSVLAGKSVLEASVELKLSPVDAYLEIISVEGERAGAIFFEMCDKNLELFLSHPRCIVASDAGIRRKGFELDPGSHPRAFGTFSRALSEYAVKRNIVPVPEMIRKMTALPADVMGISGRGYLKAGFAADIVVVDPSKLDDRATYDRPFLYPEGFSFVFVNGETAVKDGVPVAGSGHGRVVAFGKK